MPVMALTRPTPTQSFSLVQAHREGWTILEGCDPEHADIQLRGMTCSDQNAWWQVSRLSSSEREQIFLRFGPL